MDDRNRTISNLINSKVIIASLIGLVIVILRPIVVGGAPGL